MLRSSLFAYTVFIKNNEINKSCKLCQVRDKYTVGGIVFYKHLFLVSLKLRNEAGWYLFQWCSECEFHNLVYIKEECLPIAKCRQIFY